MFNQTRALTQKLGTAAFLMACSAASFAQGTGWDGPLDEVDLTGLAAKIAAAGLLIIGIAIAFKGPDLGKRVVRKV